MYYLCTIIYSLTLNLYPVIMYSIIKPLYLCNLCEAKNILPSFNSVEIKSVLVFVCLIYPSGLTLFNNKNGCPTFAGTGTLHSQPPLPHPLNPLKTVPSLGHFQQKNSHIPQVTNLNVLNFMIYFSTPYVLLFLCLKSLYPTRFAPLAVEPLYPFATLPVMPLDLFFSAINAPIHRKFSANNLLIVKLRKHFLASFDEKY